MSQLFMLCEYFSIYLIFYLPVSQKSRQGHLKKCAKDNGMTVDRLKLLMKQQEEDYAAKLEAGILPEEFK